MVDESIAFVSTGGVARGFPVTTQTGTFLNSCGVGQSFGVTTQTGTFLQTGTVAQKFSVTPALRMLFTTGGIVKTFFTTPNPATDKQLVLQINPEIGIATDCSSFEIEDATPTYDPDTEANPTGYNPEAASFSPYRAKRSELDLWVVWRIWTTDGPVTYFPTTQDGSLIPWTATVATDIQGIYQIFIIGAPVGTDYTIWRGLQTLPEYAAASPDWYETSVGTAATDCGLTNCLNQKRRAFLDGVKCGEGCDDGYVEFWGIYQTMNSLLALGQYPEAVVEYEKLKVICAEAGCACGC
jgi:hypothetical protein